VSGNFVSQWMLLSPLVRDAGLSQLKSGLTSAPRWPQAVQTKWGSRSESRTSWPTIHADREIGPDLFRKACEFGLEGLVSKHRDRPYRGGRQKYWIKVKNSKHPAIVRVMETFATNWVSK
jgi:hypothetical protein